MMRLGRRDDLSLWDAQFRRPRAGLNWDVIFCVTALLAIGAVMVFSATASFAENPNYSGTAYTYLNRHLFTMGLGAAACAVAYRFPMSFWERWAFWIGGLSVFLLVVVLIPGLGRSVNGAVRWIGFGGFQFQVSEATKLGALLVAAAFTVRKQVYMHSFQKGFFPMAIPMSFCAFLLMQQPDLGATVVIVVIVMGVLFIGGLAFGIFSTVIGIVSLLVAAMIYTSPWRVGRILAYLDPWNEERVLGDAYQLSHSLIAFGRGEIFGVGLGGSIEKLNYLPEAHTDFIMAVIAEETGFVGVILILFIFYWLIRRAFEIGRQAIKLERYFSGLFAQGVGVWIGIQVIINVGVASGALPTKGLTLPFVSYGGSAMLIMLTVVGMLLRVDRENKILMRGGQV